MKTYRTLIELIVEVFGHSPERARLAVSALSGTLERHLQLACADSRATIARLHQWAQPDEVQTGAGGRRRYSFRVEVEADIEVNSHERAAAELKQASSKIEDYTRLALEGSEVRLKEVRLGNVRLKRYYE
jgi:hypothetical protein